MAGTSGSLNRKILVAVLAVFGCVALLLFCARLVSAAPMEASYYGPGFEGNLTANGEVFDPSGYTAAHKTYAFDTKLIVTYEGRSMVVRINDRGPYVAGRELDLAQGAAEYIGLTSVGVGIVDVEVADPSTPVGPYSAPVSNASAASAPEPQEAAPAADPPQETEQNKPARQQSGGDSSADSAEPAGSVEPAKAEQVQYASQDQYVAEDQYQTETQGQDADPAPAPKPAAPAPPAPKPAVPVLPPEPEPEALESPPVELAIPNSTVKKRVELKVAAEPTPQPVEEEVVEPAPEPAPEPKEKESPEPPVEKPSDELTVLPDTGGVPLSVPAAGALLVAVGLSVRLSRR